MIKNTRNSAPEWTARQVEEATGGQWTSPPETDWKATGLCIHQTTFQDGDIAVVKEEGGRGMSVRAMLNLSSPPSAIIATPSTKLPAMGIPVLHVNNTSQAILDMGAFARKQMTGKVFAVTGSAGKTTTTAMLSDALLPWGVAPKTAHNANLPHGVSWNLASMAWDAPHVVLELAVGRMGASSTIAHPDVAIFTNLAPAHLGENSSIADIAKTKSAIFRGMVPGSAAIINRDMPEWELVHDRAERQQLKVIHFGQTDRSDYQLLGYNADEQVVTALIEGRKVEYRIGAAGIHMALNSLSVLAAITGAGLPIAPAIEQLAGFSALPGRGQEWALSLPGRTFTLIDDAYNANPSSMAVALNRLSRTKGARRIAVLGEMADLGANAQDYHTALAAQINSSKIDRVYVVGELYADFWKRIPERQKGTFEASLETLNPRLYNELKHGDIVLIKGSNSTGMQRVVAWLKIKAEIC
ncbi:UDP-N-acetylmuramoyl-tripeptide--D-alanyl-D-alanine ligase [Brucella anthropi]|uniref:UDP-N-acetylmuramoyl-tripeptide--D-alanyl-D- alanine ligase n=1 Tax=Brucella anthropi TaxID=529 RepID=UPI00384D37EE